MTHLIVATEAHFAWLAGETPAPDGLTQPEGGIEDAPTIRMIRELAAALRAAHRPATWLMAELNEVVGLCSFKGLPDAVGSAEIGYGVAAARRSHGHATAAVGLICVTARRFAMASQLRAETAVDNFASQRVLQRNAFIRVGARHDAEDGDLIIWSRSML